MARKKRKATARYTVKTLTAAVLAGAKVAPCISPTRQCPGLLSRAPFPFLILAQDARGARRLKALAAALNKLMNPPKKAKRKANRRRKVSKRRRR